MLLLFMGFCARSVGFFVVTKLGRFEASRVHANAAAGKREPSLPFHHVAASSAIPKPSQKRGLFHAPLPLLFPTELISLTLHSSSAGVPFACIYLKGSNPNHKPVFIGEEFGFIVYPDKNDIAEKIEVYPYGII